MGRAPSVSCLLVPPNLSLCSLCPCVLVSLCPYVPVFLCLCVPPTCPCVPVSLCPSVPVSLCTVYCVHDVPVYCVVVHGPRYPCVLCTTTPLPISLCLHVCKYNVIKLDLVAFVYMEAIFLVCLRTRRSESQSKKGRSA